MRGRYVLVLMGLLGGCKQRAEPAPPSIASAPRHIASAPPGVASSPLTLVSEQVSSGLIVRTGTFALPVAPSSVSSPWGFTDLELEDSQVRVEVVLAPGGAPLEKLLPESGLAIINGGYFEADFTPSTWLVAGGVELAKKSDTSKGGVLALASGKAYVGPMSGLSFEPSVAVQSFPLIVEPEGKPGIHRDDGRRAARSVACLVGPRLHFIVLAAPRGEGPTLFEAAELLRAPFPSGFGCRVALNLDGGPSSGIWFSPKLGARQRLPLAHVGYGLAVLPR
ncbi:MAG: phosphodiester glycosidase family protein [Myxococcales bacterium]|nr:MAG: phosphodiester glycosidase family protein [Myxococcales bacterium]